MSLVIPKIENNPLSNLSYAALGKGKMLHLSTRNDETLCGKYVNFSYVDTEDMGEREICSRCFKRAETRYKEARRIAYAAMRDAELDRQTYGGQPYTKDEEQRDMEAYLPGALAITDQPDTGIMILTADGPVAGTEETIREAIESVTGVADCTECGEHIIVNDVNVPAQCEDGCEMDTPEPVTVPQGEVYSAIVMKYSPNGVAWEDKTRSLAPWYSFESTGNASSDLARLINQWPEAWNIYTLPNGDFVGAWCVGDEVISVFLVERGMTEYRVHADIDIVIPGLNGVTLKEYSGVFLCSGDPSNLYYAEENEKGIAQRYVESREWPSEAVVNVRVMRMRHVPWN